MKETAIAFREAVILPSGSTRESAKTAHSRGGHTTTLRGNHEGALLCTDPQTRTRHQGKMQVWTSEDPNGSVAFPTKVDEKETDHRELKPPEA